jgi:hypothetical protein
VIVTRSDGSLRLVAQVEHGRVAGALAAGWGNAEFAGLDPRTSVVTAAAKHDEGWRAWDARVLFNELERRPLHFLEIDAGEHIRLYRQGVERVSLEDVYAGVLVGMHWTGLYRGRWARPGGAARIGGSAEDRRLQDEVVRGEEERWIAARQAAWTRDEPRSAFETRLWHHYDLLQLWDLLSLYLAVIPEQPGPVGAPVPWGPQLRELRHAAEDVLLPPVALRPGGERVALTAGVRRAGEVTLDPFPFAEPLRIDVEQTVLPDREWSRDEVAERVRTTPATVTSWLLVPPGAPADD